MIKNFQQLDEMGAKCAACLDGKFTGNDGKRHIVLCGGTGCLSSRSDEITKEFERSQDLTQEQIIEYMI